MFYVDYLYGYDVTPNMLAYTISLYLIVVGSIPGVKGHGIPRDQLSPERLTINKATFPAGYSICNVQGSFYTDFSDRTLFPMSTCPREHYDKSQHVKSNRRQHIDTEYGLIDGTASLFLVYKLSMLRVQ